MTRTALAVTALAVVGALLGAGETGWGGDVSLRSGAAQRRSAGTGACGAIDSRDGDVIHYGSSDSCPRCARGAGDGWGETEDEMTMSPDKIPCRPARCSAQAAQTIYGDAEGADMTHDGVGDLNVTHNEADGSRP